VAALVKQQQLGRAARLVGQPLGLLPADDPVLAAGSRRRC